MIGDRKIAFGENGTTSGELSVTNIDSVGLLTASPARTIVRPNVPHRSGGCLRLL